MKFQTLVSRKNKKSDVHLLFVTGRLQQCEDYRKKKRKKVEAARQQLCHITRKPVLQNLGSSNTQSNLCPVSILHKSIPGCYWPIRIADRLKTARCRFIKNASWVYGIYPQYCGTDQPEQCRSRSDATEHCLPLIQQILDTSTSSKDFYNFQLIRWYGVNVSHSPK